ncbi:BnaAnng26130D [Brassica napus]|uniref:BnaAnng26130D protein n=1 Tax=Brassica napus TaxID=3708 RepID=A0A078JQY0_BRANA|nr:BnaAnng26130D [Brassica napus]
MFEGYILSLKGHFDSEVGGLRTDLQAATTSIAHLETTVTGAFDKINQLLKSGPSGADMGATYGFSPARHSSPFRGQNDDFNYTEANPDRHTTHSGVPQSTPRDGEDVAATETASGGLGQNLDEGEMGEELPTGKQTESTHGAELRAETGVHHGGDADIGNVEVGEQGGDADSGHDPINVENPSPSVNVAAPDNSDAAKPPSRVDVDEVNVSSERRVDDPVSGVVNKIVSEAGIDKNPVRPSAGSGNDVPQTSSDVNPEKVGLDGVHDDRVDATVANKGEDTDEDDVTITKVQAGDKNTDAAGGQADGGRRFSRRTHISTKRYTPPAPPVRKKDGNKKVARQTDDNPAPPKRGKKVAAEPSNPKPRRQEKHTFIGGFSPFTPPTPAAREAFMKTMAEAKSNAPSLGSISSVASLDDLFNCTGVCSYEAVDRVVGWIRKRHDSNPSSKFDFIPPTFFIDLIRSYPAFEAMQDKSAFTFPTLGWYDRRFAYVGHLCGGHEPDMSSYFSVERCPRELNYLPFPISRLDIPVLLEHPGYAAVVALIMLEIAAVGKPLLDLALTDEEVRIAAENYAISTLCMFKVVPPNPAV